MERIGSMHISWIRLRLLVLLLLVSPCSTALAQMTKESLTPVAPIKDGKFKSSAFSIGLTGVNNFFKLDHDSQIRNPAIMKAATMVQFGYGSILKRGYWNTSVDLVSGPYNATIRDGVAIDLSGRAISAMMGYTFDGSDIRKVNGNFGAAVGLNWYDVKGNLIGAKELVADRITVDSFVMKLTGYCVTPSFFYARLNEQPRHEGNTPELLATRIEGYIVNLGVALPMALHYKITSISSGADGSTAVASSSGQATGYAAFLAITVNMGV